MEPPPTTNASNVSLAGTKSHACASTNPRQGSGTMRPEPRATYSEAQGRGLKGLRAEQTWAQSGRRKLSAVENAGLTTGGPVAVPRPPDNTSPRGKYQPSQDTTLALTSILEGRPHFSKPIPMAEASSRESPVGHLARHPKCELNSSRPHKHSTLSS